MTEHLHQHVHSALGQLAAGRPCGIFGTGTEADPFRVVFQDGEPPPAGLEDAIAAAEAAWRDADLSRAKAEARRSVAAAAEARRQHYITPGPGKVLVYERKRQEAAAIAATVAAGQTPDPADFPFAAARLEILQLDNEAAGLADVAAEWHAQAAAWATVGAAIELAYDQALRAIDAAADAAAVRAAVDAVEWP